jgi:hypothetical protein
MSSTAETMGRYGARTRRRPSHAWYWVAAAVVLLGVAAGVAWGTVATLHTHQQAQDLPRTGLPGRLEVATTAGTSTIIFFEGEGKPSPAELGLTVTGPNGSQVPVRPYDLRMDYEIGGWTGTPVASFSAPDTGTYVVAAQKTSGAGEIAAGANFVRAQALNIVGALALISASIALGLVMVVVTIVRRSHLSA